MGRFSSVGEVLREYSRISTAHGLRRSGWAQHWWAKLFWFILFVISLAALIVLIVALLVDYWSYPIKSSTTSVNGIPKFPSVTVCNLNSVKLTDATVGLKAEQVAHCNATCTTRKILQKCKCIVGDADRPCASIKQTACVETVNSDVSKGACARECFPDPNAGEIGNMVIYCSFNGLLCDATKVFTKADVNEGDFGTCYTFNGGKYGESEIKSSGDSGPSYGLTLVFNAERHQHHPSGDIREGFRVAIHSPQSRPYPHVDGFLVPTGMETIMIVHQKEQERLAPPYAECEESLTDENGYRLTSNSCVTKCKGKPVCECHPPCNEQEYPLDFSVTAWPSPNHENSLRNMFTSVKGADYEYNVEELASLKVFFKEFTRTIVEQKPLNSVARLLTQIGGLSGLLVGISMLTLLEGVEMVASFVKTGFAGKEEDEHSLAGEGESVGTSSPMAGSRPPSSHLERSSNGPPLPTEEM